MTQIHESVASDSGDLSSLQTKPWSDHDLITSAVLPLQTERPLTFNELFDRYALSLHGQAHSLQPLRYSQYHGFSRERMLRLLGEDVHPVEHNRFAAEEVTVPLLYFQNCMADGQDMQNFSPMQIVGLRFAAYMHDIGESEHPSLVEVCGSTVGDKVSGTKTDTDRSTEAAIRKHLYKQYYSDLPESFLGYVEGIISKTGGDTFAVEAFQASERIGFVQNALRAGYHAVLERRHRTQDGGVLADEEYRKLLHLALKVGPEQSRLLQPYQDTYAYVGHVLGQALPLLEMHSRELADHAPDSLSYSPHLQ